MLRLAIINGELADYKHNINDMKIVPNVEDSKPIYAKIDNFISGLFDKNPDKEP
jgi:hypothetical protein